MTSRPSPLLLCIWSTAGESSKSARMKSYVTLLMRYVHTRSGQRNVRLLLRYLLVFLSLVIVYSLLFHALMLREGQRHSWLTGFYWTLTVMSTLGFGDITFQTDFGRIFSMVVLLSGMAFLLVLMPFTFIEFFYSPWMQAQSEARAPRRLAPNVRDHAILTHINPVSMALIQKLKQYNYPYVMVVRDLAQALELHDLDYNVVIGAPDSPETYHNVNVRQAALVTATGDEIINTNIAFTVREIAPHVPIVTLADTDAAEEILKLAGSSRVLRLHEMMGRSLAHRTIGGDARAHVIGRFEELFIAEATAAGTPLSGKSIAESHLRELVGITVVGVWERGRFQTAGPETIIGPHTVLVLAGSHEQLKRYNELFCIYHVSSAPVIVIGGGRVGRATGESLDRRGLGFVIIERNPPADHPPGRYVHGDAAGIGVLEQAGIREAPAVIITTNNDDANVYLTILCRRLRPDIQIISRATREQNVSTLHRAGADFVMSYASMGANAIFNVLRRADILMLAEGLTVFRVKVPPSLVGKTIAESAVRSQTGCSIVALKSDAALEINPDPNRTLTAEAELILIGVVEDENRFLKAYA
jgi:voltage-gated potassium channel